MTCNKPIYCPNCEKQAHREMPKEYPYEVWGICVEYDCNVITFQLE